MHWSMHCNCIRQSIWSKYVEINFQYIFPLKSVRQESTKVLFLVTQLKTKSPLFPLTLKVDSKAVRCGVVWWSWGKQRNFPQEGFFSTSDQCYKAFRREAAICTFKFFLKKMGQFQPLFVYFRSFQTHI